jgi:Protein of unknown function (DUF3373)
MKRFIPAFIALLLLISAPATWAQVQAPANSSEAEQMQQQINTLKNQLSALEGRLKAQEEAAKQKAAATPEEGTVSAGELKAEVKELDQRVGKTERKSALDRLQWSGDFRVESHSIFGNVPKHYDGMQLQNLMVKSLWFAGQNGITPGQMAGMLSSPTLPNGAANTPANFAALVNGAVANNYGSYQFFANNLTYKQLQQMVSGFTPQQMAGMQQYLKGAPGVLVPGYAADTNVLMTNRLRLNFDSQVADNVTVGARLSMYKTFGDSTNVQVFNGQANTLNLDGTTARVPTGDMVRVERAFFTWKDIGGSKMYLSVGRRPSTDGPPMNFKEDEPRGGTPSGTLFDYQYDGVTLGYHITDKMTARACYGMGYTSGYGNGNLLQSPADRLKDVHLFGGMIDLIETDKTFVQALVAHAWNVTDGFNGTMVLPNNPVTGDPVGAPVVMRFTPSANLGGINLYGLTMQRRLGQFDAFFSANIDSLRPNGVTTPFGGLGSDPFETPTDHDGYMFYAGLRYNIPQNDGRTKIGFEFNHGSKYWFNFAQAEDDILAPKSSARGEVYETYLTHRINPHFILKADYQRFNYAWSGSGWHLGAPKRLNSTPLLGFPTYDTASMFTVGLTARF